MAKYTIAKVLVNLGFDKEFDYLIPAALQDKIQVGMRVNVPFGNGDSTRGAYVVALSGNSARTDLKTIASIDTAHPKIPDSLLSLGEWMATYYCCPREYAIRCLLPSAIRSGKIRNKIVKRYFIDDEEKAVELIEKGSQKVQGRIEILKMLQNQPGMDADSLISAAGTGKSVLKALLKAGYVREEEERINRDPLRGAVIQPTLPLPPTPEQQKALQTIFQMMDQPDGQHVLLLHGVTCSGKTEVYLQAIAHVLEKGGDSIVLVPEISLTPQTVTRFKSRFGNQVSVLHSGLTDGERHDEWMKVHRGEVKIAVGARSALFAPFHDLQLIIVDEEHENSYKQSEAPRYHARDVAVMRGKMENALVILGSATPSLESYYNARNGKYKLAEMLKRSDPNILLPEVDILDMRLEKDENERTPYFSKILIDAVFQRIRNGEQSIIFLNKRGFARQMHCDLCGYVAECPDCSMPYTYHKKAQVLSCHLCGAVIDAYEKCPGCESDQIRYQGAGTERIESISTDIFKGARIARMDSDTMTNSASYERVLDAFRRGDLDILIGTQMIAKGLDFPNVTLVGIVNADGGLYIKDFRAPERSFQLLAQVAGRAGRGTVKGNVLIQTENPYNPAIQCAAEHDYISFYEDEIMIREELNLPPICHMLALHFDGPDPDDITCNANKLLDILKNHPAGAELEFDELSPCVIERIKGKYRFMARIRGHKFSAMRKLIREELKKWKKFNKQIEVYVDMDPVNLL